MFLPLGFPFYTLYHIQQQISIILYSMNIGYVWVLANYPGDAGAVDLDTPAKMLDRLFSEVINDVVNMDENKTHILNVLTLSKWEESEVR